VSFTEHDVERSGDGTSRPADSERSRRPNLMSFPSLEHLDRLNDGSPWRSSTRRRRKFRGGIGGLHRRRGERADDDDVEDEVELDRVDDSAVEAVPDTTNRRPARTTSGVSRSASAAAARQRERQQLTANRGGQPTPEPDNRIYRPVKKSQPLALPPPPLAPRAPAPVARDELRVHAAQPNSDGEMTESKQRRQRRRRQRGDGEAVPQAPTESQAAVDRQMPQASTKPHAEVDEPPRRVHQRQNGSSGNVGHGTATDEVAVQPEAEAVSRGERRRTSRRAADSRGARRTETRTATVV